MLDRAEQRVRSAGSARVTTVPGDIREVDLGEQSFDIILAAAVLHHLRSDAEWESVLAAFFRALSAGGSVWIFDLIEGATPVLQALAWRRYGEYLAGLGGDDYRQRVFAYVEKEDTPRPLAYQLELLRRVGFRDIEVLHKHGCFAAFGAIKGEE
jgi:tRNA (cmo5U34)-methyltransferase